MNSLAKKMKYFLRLQYFKEKASEWTLFLYDFKCSFTLFQRMGVILHFLNFDAFQGTHEFQQEADTAFKALDFCYHIAVFHIFYPSCQFQPFCHLFQLETEAYMLYPAAKGDMPTDKTILLKIGQFDLFYLMDGVVVSVFLNVSTSLMGITSLVQLDIKRIFSMFLQLYKEGWDMSSIFLEKDSFLRDKFCFWVCVFGKIYYNKTINGIMLLVWEKPQHR